MMNVNTMVNGNENIAPSGETQTQRADDNIARDEFCRQETIPPESPVPVGETTGTERLLVNPSPPKTTKKNNWRSKKPLKQDKDVRPGFILKAGRD